MFCQSCGNKLDKDASFCSKCGAKKNDIKNQSEASDTVAKSSYSGIQSIISIAVIFSVLMYIMLGSHLLSQKSTKNQSEIKLTTSDKNVTQESNMTDVLKENIAEQNQVEQTESNSTNAVNANSDLMNNENIESFLNKLLSSGCFYSEGDVSNYYANNVKRYFSFNNPTHKQLFEDNVKYCQRWTTRNYQLNSYSITNKYNLDNTEYVDLVVEIGYDVSNGDKSHSGISKQFITLMNENSQLKVKQSYALK